MPDNGAVAGNRTCSVVLYITPFASAAPAAGPRAFHETSKVFRVVLCNRTSPKALAVAVHSLLCRKDSKRSRSLFLRLAICRLSRLEAQHDYWQQRYLLLLNVALNATCFATLAAIMGCMLGLLLHTDERTVIEYTPVMLHQHPKCDSCPEPVHTAATGTCQVRAASRRDMRPHPQWRCMTR